MISECEELHACLAAVNHKRHLICICCSYSLCKAGSYVLVASVISLDWQKLKSCAVLWNVWTAFCICWYQSL